jgi:hypothetical protein
MTIDETHGLACRDAVVQSPYAFDPTTSEGPKREGRDLFARCCDSLSALLHSPKQPRV